MKTMEKRKVPAISLRVLAERIGGELVGDGQQLIRRLSPFDQATEEDLTFIDPKNPKMMAALANCRAGGIIVNRAAEVPPGIRATRVDPPHLGLARALEILPPGGDDAERSDILLELVEHAATLLATGNPWDERTARAQLERARALGTQLRLTGLLHRIDELGAR